MEEMTSGTKNNRNYIKCSQLKLSDLFIAELIELSKFLGPHFVPLALEEGQMEGLYLWQNSLTTLILKWFI